MPPLCLHSIRAARVRDCGTDDQWQELTKGCGVQKTICFPPLSVDNAESRVRLLMKDLQQWLLVEVFSQKGHVASSSLRASARSCAAQFFVLLVSIAGSLEAAGRSSHEGRWQPGGLGEDCPVAGGALIRPGASLLVDKGSAGRSGDRGRRLDVRPVIVSGRAGKWPRRLGGAVASQASCGARGTSPHGQASHKFGIGNARGAHIGAHCGSRSIGCRS